MNIHHNMNDVAIRVTGVSKQYWIGQRQQYDSFQEAIVGAFRQFIPFRRLQHTPFTEFWALRDVSFAVPKGAVLGIIGRNGAGKSTLLKILAQITEPTMGRVEMFGRVGSLLEVGTGFHPELTGRENIFLNGAILGMRRAEIMRNFDEIVAFAEVERFLDTPVKHYSSGMYVRLAFAVAAHLQTEILLIDEVLAVGDTSFQKKCLGKMGDVAQQGRTVLLVSHNMAAVANLCQQVVVLEGGRLVHTGDAQIAVVRYLQGDGGQKSAGTLQTHDRQGQGPIRFTTFHCQTPTGEIIQNPVCGQPVQFVLRYHASAPQKPFQCEVSIGLCLPDGTRLVNLSTHFFPDFLAGELPATGLFVCEIPQFPLRFGQYLVDLYCQVDTQLSDYLRAATTLQVYDGDFYQTGKLVNAGTGSVVLPHSWQLQPESPSSPDLLF